MHPIESEPPESESACREVFAGFVARRSAGEEVDFEEWVAGRGEHEEALRRLHEDWLRLRSRLDRLHRETFLFAPPSPGPPPASPLRPGDMIDEYRLIQVIGKGGMGEVWEAVQVSLDRKVALKLLRSDGVISERKLRRFQREAQAGGRLNHPGIVTVHAVGSDGGRPFIVQELVEGSCTLADFLERMRSEPELPRNYFERVAEFTIQVLDALQCAHDAGVVHRDLKPQNILVTPEDEPKIADFGLAHVADAETLSQTGEFAGTYSYMSPEQAMSRRIGKIDARSDVFSMGATLYEILTLHRAFDGDTTHQITEKIIYQDPPDPRSVRSRVPPELAVICGKALEKRRVHRFQTMAEFAAELRRFLRHEPILTQPVGLSRRVRKWVQRHKMLSSVGSVGALALVVIAILVGYGLAVRRGMIDARAEEYLASAQISILWDDLEEARARVDLANELRPEDPRGDLLLAVAYAKYDRMQEVQRLLDRARSKGYEPYAGEEASAIDHFCRGLYILAANDRTRYDEAKDEFEAALAEDPTLYNAHYSLYVLYLERGDDERASEALLGYQGVLRPSDDFYAVVEAKRNLLDREPEAALRVLRELQARPDMTEERLVELRFHRMIGYVYLVLGRLDEAEGWLRRAVELFPDDCYRWANLAALHAKRYQETGDLAALSRAEEAAGRARDCDRLLLDARQVLAFAAVERYGAERSAARLRAAEEELDAFGRRAASPEATAKVELLRAILLVYRARVPLAADRWEPASTLFLEALAHDPENLEALVLGAEALWRLRRWEEALGQLEEAGAVWAEGKGGPAGDRRWWCTIQVWTFDTAGKLGDLDRARAAKAALEEILATGFRPEPEELLTYAEFLATPARDELRDCPRAEEVIEEYGLREHFARLDEAQRILHRIDEACR